VHSTDAVAHHGSAPNTEPRPDVKLIQDHIIGLAAGGLDVVGNYQWLCQPCHAEKTKAEQAAGRARAIAKRGSVSRRYRDLEPHPGRIHDQ
jgi:HNH endonuclease